MAVAIGTVTGIATAIFLAGKAIYEAIPDKDLNRSIDDAEKRKDRGLSKKEETELAALLSSTDAGKERARVRALQQGMAGSGQVTGSDAILSSEVLAEQDRKNTRERGLAISRADEAEKDRASQELMRLKMEKGQAEADRNAAIEKAALYTAQFAGTEYDAAQARNVHGNKDREIFNQSQKKAVGQTSFGDQYVPGLASQVGSNVNPKTASIFAKYPQLTPIQIEMANQNIGIIASRQMPTDQQVEDAIRYASTF